MGHVTELAVADALRVTVILLAAYSAWLAWTIWDEFSGDPRIDLVGHIFWMIISYFLGVGFLLITVVPLIATGHDLTWVSPYGITWIGTGIYAFRRMRRYRRHLLGDFSPRRDDP